MTIETATYIHELDEMRPVEASQIGEDDDHLRLIKTALKSTFPNIDGPVNLTTSQLNELPGAVEKTKEEKTDLEAEKAHGISEAEARKAEVLAYVWSDLDLEQDFAHSEIYALFYDLGGANTLSSDWVKCDGTNGTEDLTSKAIQLLNGDSSQDSLIPINHFHGLYVVKYVGV